MDYKKKYNKLVEAIKVLQETNPSDEGIHNWVNDNVPELHKSEDEEIRKKLLSSFKGIMADADEDELWYGLPYNDIIAWLEKQGNNINCIYDKELSELLHIVICRYINDPDISYPERENVSKKILPYVELLEKQGQHAKFINNIQIGDQVTRNQDGMLINLSQLKRVAKPSEKPCESIEYANKVEPKFKVGEWVVTDMNNIVQIKAVNNGYYTIDNGSDFNMYYVDKCWHLWTIQDAKDGNVLAAEDKDKIFIYNGKLDLRGRVCAYCGIYKTYDGLRFTKCAIGNYFTYKEPYPATKEQRDTLIKAMTDAGYTFDFEKKELKKIIDEKQIKKNLQDNSFRRMFEQKPDEWHREDEQNLNACLGYIPDEFLRRWLTDIIHVKYDKNAWSEEDKNMLQSILDEYKSMPIEKRNWLKSLKGRVQPQKQWKPSKEQLYYLSWIANIKLGDSIVEQEVSKHLNELYEQLKQL